MRIEDEKVKMAFFELLRDQAKIPHCLKCGKLFDLGFPDTVDGVADNLICNASGLICFCENHQKVIEAYSVGEDKELDISEWYK